jgi:hypothetical protein
MLGSPPVKPAGFLSRLRNQDGEKTALRKAA